MTVYIFPWRNNEKRATLYGRRFVVLARGALNSVMVRFLDNGERCVISRNALRRAK